MPQVATGCHRLPQGGQPSGTHSTRGAAKHAINQLNINDMANGRLWDDHFRHLGHPPKFYRVQDASSGNNSPFWYHFRIILLKTPKCQPSNLGPRGLVKSKVELRLCRNCMIVGHLKNIYAKSLIFQKTQKLTKNKNRGVRRV